LGNAASAGNAVQPAAAATMDAALAGARRAELLAATFDGGGRSGARVADTDMGAMDDGFRSPCSQSTHPHLRFRPHTHDARCCITYLTRASAKSREISATRIVSSVQILCGPSACARLCVLTADSTGSQLNVRADVEGS
jgi:hypothetical protein